MICISINQESRRLALFDMFNAAPQCDLLEVRMDRFGKAPDIGEILTNKPKPVIMTCRRPADGGMWEGSEEERLALLRQCIISKADYVEIELDVADQVRRFPGCQRVISYTNLQETPEDIADIYAQAQTKHPDVIKLVTLARTPEEAWPLVHIVAKARVPTVVVGLGKPGVMLSVLGKKIGAPWVYAALERGMESYPGQPTVSDLKDVYHYHAIGRGTRLIGVTGFGEREYLTVAVLNAALTHFELSARCWPLGVGNVRILRKIMEAVKLAGVIVDPAHQQAILEMAPQLHATAKENGAADILLFKDEGWHAFHTASRAWIESLCAAMKTTEATEQPLKDRMVVLAGLGGPTRTMAVEIHKRGGSVILASYRKKAVQQLAQALGCRFIQHDAIYSTLHNVLVICDEEKEESAGRGDLHPSYLKPGMVVMDLTASARPSEFLRQAQDRGCTVITPQQLFLQQIAQQARMLTGKHVPREVLERAIPESFAEEA